MRTLLLSILKNVCPVYPEDVQFSGLFTVKVYGIFKTNSLTAGNIYIPPIGG